MKKRDLEEKVVVMEQMLRTANAILELNQALMETFSLFSDDEKLEAAMEAARLEREGKDGQGNG